MRAIWFSLPSWDNEDPKEEWRLSFKTKLDELAIKERDNKLSDNETRNIAYKNIEPLLLFDPYIQINKLFQSLDDSNIAPKHNNSSFIFNGIENISPNKIRNSWSSFLSDSQGSPFTKSPFNNRSRSFSDDRSNLMRKEKELRHDNSTDNFSILDLDNFSTNNKDISIIEFDNNVSNDNENSEFLKIDDEYSSYLENMNKDLNLTAISTQSIEDPKIDNKMSEINIIDQSLNELKSLILLGSAKKANSLIQYKKLNISVDFANELLSLCNGKFANMEEPMETFELLESLGAVL